MAIQIFESFDSVDKAKEYIIKTDPLENPYNILVYN